MARGGTLVVDDADVQRVADVVLKAPELVNAPAEAQAELAHKLALGVAKSSGTTVAWAEELAHKVRRRVEFSLMSRRRSQSSDVNNTGSP